MAQIEMLPNLIKRSFSFGKKFVSDVFAPKIGLALSGGSVWGLAHIGVLKALEEYQIPISYISGTSVGALIGGLYASGISASKLEELAYQTQWKDLCRFAIPHGGLFTNEPMESLIHKHIGYKTFEDLKIPFAAICTDLISGEEVVIQSGKFTTAIRASTAIPGIFQPVVVEGRTLVDGGVVNNLPVTQLKKMGANYTIAVHLFSDLNQWIPKTGPEIILKSFLIMQHRASWHEISQADLLIDINLKGFNPIDLNQSKKLIQRGYERALEKRKEIKKISRQQKSS
ncbi:MAG TPA: patatin-like phospholipase family protein [Clostridiales bacterium]|nr:patatin-like phospholipase family protein [Clostridiales bacterium]